MCKCVSNNRPRPEQTDQLVRLEVPRAFTPEAEHPRSVSIDACIAPVIKHLWDSGIWTLNSCCGHNGLFGDSRPSIIFDQNLTQEKADEIRRTIAEVDDREFRILSWVLTDL